MHAFVTGQPAASTRKRKHDPPLGWTQVTVMNGDKPKKMWRCGCLQRDLTGQIRRCSYICRKNQTTKRHDHVYTVKPKDDPLLPPTIQEANRLSTGQFLAELTRLVAEFIGETHLSVSMGASEAMRSFCVNLMRFALDQRDAHPGIHFRPDLLVTGFNARELTHEIVAAGDRAFLYLERSLLKFKFVNVMIDAATVVNMRVVHVTLANPFSGQAPNCYCYC